MKLIAKIAWNDEARTRGKVRLLWHCADHGLQTRADLDQGPPPCPMCEGLHVEARKTKAGTVSVLTR